MRLKRKGESFSDVIIRITRSTSLLEYVESTEFPDELADKVEEVYKARELVAKGERLATILINAAELFKGAYRSKTLMRTSP
uniref:Uncharacterized protein n=1 Tax=Archaeoglobus fulgidus TaxID=2234 RepID=A0A7J2TJ92_ARCFL